VSVFDPDVFDPAVFDAGAVVVESRPLPTGTVVTVLGADLTVLMPAATLRTAVTGELRTS
jgi:hypothetical protein